MKPQCARQAPAAASSSGSGRPSAASTSALPDLLDTERLPCLTTGRPQAAASSDAPVDRFKLLRAVAAGADDVDVRARRNLRHARELAHRAREAADLVGGLALQAQRHEQRARERRRELAAGHDAQQVARRRLVEVFAAEQTFEQLLRLRAHG